MDLRDQLQTSLGTAYVLERELGGGGMSRVFVADERRLNRKVVVKVLSPELAAGVNVERFERETQLAASLQQANIVPILAAGEADGLPYYVMPFVDGESLRMRHAREEHLDVGMVVGVLRDVAKALAYAHERGVVHRDIKPDNVLLSGGTAVVTDFGIAKAISMARAERGAALTQVGTSIGTPAYMSPEQAAGDPAVDHRADIYSFGCMAYELLGGYSPFDGRTPARMLAAHIHETPTAIDEVRTEVPPALARLVMRCLEKDPALRPQSGAEIVQALDAVTSGTRTAETVEPPPGLGRTLAIYAGAALGLTVVARAAVIAFGVPEWVFTGALLLALLGLPVILYTWNAHRTRPRSALQRLTWRRVWTGGVVTVGVFASLVIAFMALRALGIGPAGSLLAAGMLDNRGRLIVTSFSAPDSSLGMLVSEAVRTNLGQSRVVSIMPPVAITAALQRMQRPPASPITTDLAREIALREGVKAIVDGAVRPLGSGYALSLRLVSADSLRELAAYQETADRLDEILPAIDRLTRQLRGRIGESLRDVRDSPMLEQVTTPSLEALRIYAEAARSIDIGGNPLTAAERLRDAVRIDTAFAMAWRKLGVALFNIGSPRARIDSALERAYRFRDRLTERERLLAEGTYFQLGPGRDRRRAIRAYESLLAMDPNESGAANNLAIILSDRREFARAESLYRRQIASGRATSQQYTNLVSVLFNSGKIADAERTLDEFRTRFPGSPASETGRMHFLYQRGELDSLETFLDQLVRSPNSVVQLQGMFVAANYALLRGRLGDVARYSARTRELQAAFGQAPNAIIDSLQLSFIDALVLEDTARAVRRMEATLARTPLRSLPADERPTLEVARLFAIAHQPARARALLAEHDADLADSVLRRAAEPLRHGVLGSIAVAEGRPRDAIRELWRSDSAYDGPAGNCGVCVYDDLGWAYDRAGVADSAILYWEKYLNTPYYARIGSDAAERPFIVRRLGELYEAKGDVPNAARSYREFLMLWKDADARLRPKVEDVRFRLSKLADIESR